MAELDASCIYKDSQRGFQRIVGQILGVPAESIIDDVQYRNLADVLRDGAFFRELAMRAHHPYAEDLYHYWYRYWRDMMKARPDDPWTVTFPDRPTELLGLHALSLLVSPTKYSGMQWPFFLPPFPRRRLHRILPNEKMGMTEEALQLGMNCFFTAVSADDRVLRFTKAAGNFDIPSGQSPSARSDSLTKLIETSKKVCLAPLAIGGTAAISQLSQGNYAAALLSTATGAAMTLMLVGTVSVADYLVHYLLYKRNSISEAENSNDDRQR